MSLCSRTFQTFGLLSDRLIALRYSRACFAQVLGHVWLWLATAANARTANIVRVVLAFMSNAPLSENSRGLPTICQFQTCCYYRRSKSHLVLLHWKQWPVRFQ